MLTSGHSEHILTVERPARQSPLVTFTGWEEVAHMKQMTQGIRYGHVWRHFVAHRVTVTLGSFAAMLLASGAGCHWH